MDMIWPSQTAQPLGAKLKGKMRISATKGLAMAISLGLRREDAEQRDDEVDAEIGLEVAVRLVSAGGTDGRGKQRQGAGGRDVHLVAGKVHRRQETSRRALG